MCDSSAQNEQNYSLCAVRYTWPDEMEATRQELTVNFGERFILPEYNESNIQYTASAMIDDRFQVVIHGAVPTLVLCKSR